MVKLVVACLGDSNTIQANAHPRSAVTLCPVRAKPRKPPARPRGVTQRLFPSLD